MSIILCLMPKERVNSTASSISREGIYGVLIVMATMADFLTL
jgi:hypothetical protein